MGLLLFVIIIGLSFVIFFADEIIAIIKKFFSIPGFTLFIPLIAASYIVEKYEQIIYSIIMLLVRACHTTIHFLASLLAINHAISYVHIFFLFCIAALPILIPMIYQQCKNKRYPAWRYGYRISTTLWLIAVIGLLVYSP